MIEHHTTDIRDTHCRFIAHGCNAQGKMGSGVAKALRDRWPEIYKAYLDHLDVIAFDQQLGSIGTLRIANDTKLLANIITQRFYGRDGKQYASYEAIETGLERFVEVCKNFKFHADNLFYDIMPRVEIAIPQIGCHLGGCEWSKVLPIIEGLAAKHDVDFHIYKFDA